MKRVLLQDWKLPPNWLRFLIISVLILGLLFRFVNLDKKIYWYDETDSSLWISGNTRLNVIDKLYNGHVIKVEDLHKYQGLNSDKDFTDTIKSVGVDSPQHAPLYYVMLRLWVQLFGNSVAVTRSLSVFISLLIFPCIYWLCLELFKSSLVGYIAVAIVAVSPYHVLYAQEAREYCLWSVTILLSSASLLQAIRTNKNINWVFYAITLALALYTYVFSILVAFGHGIYVIATQSWQLSKRVSAYLVASFVGLLTFTPWLFLLISSFASGQVSKDTGELNIKISFLEQAKRWVGVLSRIFFDLGLDSSDSLTLVVPALLPIFLLLVLIGYSFYFLCNTTPKQVWLFILTLTGVPTLILVLRDLISGGILSTTSRFLFPCFLGIQLAVAYLIATQITVAKSWRQKLWQIVLVALLSSGIVSCAVSSQAEIWWNKGSSVTKQDLEMARIINQTKNPLLISDFTGSLMSLSYMLEPKVRLLLLREPNLLRVPGGFSDVFLYRPSKALLNQFEQEPKYNVKSVDQAGYQVCSTCAKISNGK